MRKRVLRIKYIAFVIVFILLLLLVYRFISPRQIDDVSSNINCSEKLLNKSDILFVIPKFRNISIADNQSWCQYILSLNKTIAMHGVYHTYNEFGTDVNEKYLEEGIDIFYECFGFYPAEFKAPQWEINKKNKELIKKNDMNLHSLLSAFLHKTYHCQENGEYAIHITDKIVLRNRFIDWV